MSNLGQQSATNSSIKLLLKLTIISDIHFDARPSLGCMKTFVCYGSAQIVPLTPFNATYELSLCKKYFALVLSNACFLDQLVIVYLVDEKIWEQSYVCSLSAPICI